MSFGSPGGSPGSFSATGLGQRWSKYWHYAAIIGLFAVTAGVCVPLRLPTRSTEAPAATIPQSADEGNLSYTPPSLPDAPSARSMLLRLALGTIIVLALCAGTLWIGKRWVQAKPAATLGGQVRLIESLALNRQCTLHLIAAGTQQVLVGVDGGGIKGILSLVTPFEDSLNESQATETGAASASPEEIALPAKQAA